MRCRTACILPLLLAVSSVAAAQDAGPAIEDTAGTFVARPLTDSTTATATTGAAAPVPPNPFGAASAPPMTAVVPVDWLGVEAGVGRHWYRGEGWNEMSRDGFAAGHFVSDGPRLAVTAALPSHRGVALSGAIEWNEWERSHDAFSDPTRDKLDLSVDDVQLDARVEARGRADMALFIEGGGGVLRSWFSLGGPFDRRVSASTTAPIAHAAAGFVACPQGSRAVLTVRLGVSTAVARFPSASAPLDLGGVDAGFEIGARFGNARKGWR